MKIYMVVASWYDVHEKSCHRNICAFTSKESAQKWIDEFPDDKELMDAFDKYIFFGCASHDEVDFWIEEYELKD